jgi:peptide/nickel transport system permease protein
MARFRKDKLSMIAFVIVVVYVLIGVLAPLLVHFGVLDPLQTRNSAKFLDIEAGSIPRGFLGGISASHPLGLEPGTGRDVLSRLVLGVTTSLTIALMATVVAMGLGTVLGIISGFVGGVVDSVVGRLIDLTLSFPQTLMLLALSGLAVATLVQVGIPAGDLANGTYVTLVLGLFGWPPIARIVRGQVLSIREREFIDAARLMGAPRRRMYFKEVLPNLWAPLLVYFTLTMPAYISAEAALSFLGVGVKPPTPTLGNILTDSISYSQADFFFFFSPAFLIALIVVSFNLLGDGLRDALDPRGAR